MLIMYGEKQNQNNVFVTTEKREKEALKYWKNAGIEIDKDTRCETESHWVSVLVDVDVQVDTDY